MKDKEIDVFAEHKAQILKRDDIVRDEELWQAFRGFHGGSNTATLLAQLISMRSSVDNIAVDVVIRALMEAFTRDRLAEFPTSNADLAALANLLTATVADRTTFAELDIYRYVVEPRGVWAVSRGNPAFQKIAPIQVSDKDDEL